MIFSPIAHIGRKLSENVPSVPGFLPTYDAAGNLIQNGTTSYTYDAENRLIATASTSYVYDGYGNRIEKCTEGANAQGVGLPGTCATNATGTFYWLHKDGGTLTESDLGGNFTEVYDRLYGQIAARIDLPAKVVHYYFHDHLNSTSIVTDALGNIENESDYYPYGGEIVISSGDSNRYKFTGKERDSESNLDMFGARYYGSSLGRFMTPDWAAKPTAVPYAHYGNPQSLNLYSYVQNNPTTIGDPDGHWPTFRLGGTWTHSDIVDAAYPGLSAAQRQIIKNGSAKADEDQSRAGAPAHGMTPKGEDKAIAMRDAAKIVANSESAARNDQAAYTAAGGKGIADSALSAVAPAFHEQTDETSPAHAGFQEWGGMGEGNAIQQLQEVAAGAEHAARESSATPEEKAASIAAAQRVLQSVLPPDLYQKAITPPKQQ